MFQPLAFTGTFLGKMLQLPDALRGRTDELIEDILSYIHAGDTFALAKDAVPLPRRRLVHEFMLKGLAHKVLSPLSVEMIYLKPITPNQTIKDVVRASIPSCRADQ